jgi:hypothetical protein
MKNKAAQELAQKRHLSLSPERRKEIAIKASKAASEKRREKLSTPPLDSDDTLR